MTRETTRMAAFLALTLAAAAPVALGQHAGDIWVARSGSGQLDRAGFDVDVNLKLLSPGDGGWSDSNPGFDRLLTPQPQNDLFSLESGCRIFLEAVELDPGLIIVQIGTFQVMDGPGDRLSLRPLGPSLHEHLLFLIDSTSPNYNANWGVWHATVRLVDTGTTGYAPSEEFTLKFINRPMARGDMNCDGFVTVSDIGGFVQALLSPVDYATNFPACDYILGDVNEDTFVTVSDIGAFVTLLTN